MADLVEHDELEVRTSLVRGARGRDVDDAIAFAMEQERSRGDALDHPEEGRATRNRRDDRSRRFGECEVHPSSFVTRSRELEERRRDVGWNARRIHAAERHELVEMILG